MPVVVECKSEGDTSTFFGLVQALTYASDLLLGNQYQRLLDEIKWKGKFSSENKKVAIMILIENAESDKTIEGTLKLIPDIVKTCKNHIAWIKIVQGVFEGETLKLIEL